jgi:hypothetical protein
MSKAYSDITNEINDKLNDTNFTNNRTSETLRAINTALEDINIGNTREDKGMDIEVGYDFQLQTDDVSFVSGTKQYTFATLGITASNFKFANDLRIQTDRNILFTEVKSDYFFRKEGVYSSTENMYTLHTDAGTTSLWINYTVTDTLDFEYFTNFMVSDSGGTNRANVFSDTTATRLLLIPDRFWLVVPYLAAAELAFQRFGDQSEILSICGKKALK